MQDYISKEIDIIQSEIARCDASSLTIKGWCITVWSGLFAVGVTSSSKELFCLAVVSTVFFAIAEFFDRLLQASFIIRSNQIESLINAGKLQNYIYSVNATARNKLPGLVFWCRFKVAIGQPQFWIFYISLVLFGFLVLAIK